MLLRWAKSKTKGYPGVEVEDIRHSWSNGLAYNALIHSYRPDLVDFQKLQQTGQRESLAFAFEVASKELGVPKLLDAEDFDTTTPDRRSMLIYLSQIYHVFENNPK